MDRIYHFYYSLSPLIWENKNAEVRFNSYLPRAFKIENRIRERGRKRSALLVTVTT